MSLTVSVKKLAQTGQNLGQKSKITDFTTEFFIRNLKTENLRSINDEKVHKNS